jgi:hypothetical protein
MELSANQPGLCDGHACHNRRWWAKNRFLVFFTVFCPGVLPTRPCPPLNAAATPSMTHSSRLTFQQQHNGGNGMGAVHGAERWVFRNSTRIGRVFHKMIYRAYTDETFSQPVAVSPDWCGNTVLERCRSPYYCVRTCRVHLGLLGPLLRAEVGRRLSSELFATL